MTAARPSAASGSVENPMDKVEDALAEAMLDEIINNKTILALLAKAAELVNDNVLKPMIEAYKSNEFSFTKATPETSVYKSALKYIIEQNSSDGRQQTGIFRDFTQKEIEDSEQKVEILLTTFQKNLLILSNQEADKKVDKKDILKCMKSLTDICLCYADFMKLMSANNQAAFNKLIVDKKSTDPEEFDVLRSIVMPSAEEAFARIPFNLAFPGEQRYTVSSGISRRSADFVDQKTARSNSDAYTSGKSAFVAVSSQRSLALYMEKLSKMDPESKDAKDLQQKIIQFIGQFTRSSVDKIKSSTIEKYANKSNLSLVATTSGTEARTLITLYHLGLFGKQQDFNPKLARLISNCLFAVLQNSGHHSYIELVEPYNRLLDLVALQVIPKSLNSGASPADLLSRMTAASKSSATMTTAVAGTPATAGAGVDVKKAPTDTAAAVAETPPAASAGVDVKTSANTVTQVAVMIHAPSATNTTTISSSQMNNEAALIMKAATICCSQVPIYDAGTPANLLFFISEEIRARVENGMNTILAATATHSVTDTTSPPVSTNKK